MSNNIVFILFVSLLCLNTPEFWSIYLFFLINLQTSLFSFYYDWYHFVFCRSTNHFILLNKHNFSPVNQFTVKIYVLLLQQNNLFFSSSEPLYLDMPCKQIFSLNNQCHIPVIITNHTFPKWCDLWVRNFLSQGLFWFSSFII